MTVTLSKSSLLKEQAMLKTYQKFIPTLDLKRKQLIAEQIKVQHRIEKINEELAKISQKVNHVLPMLAGSKLDLNGLIIVKALQKGEENIVGVKVPVLLAVDVELSDYPLLSVPHWVDVLVEMLRESIELKFKIDVENERYELLSEAQRKTTQRLNLFEKVKVPQTKENMKKIKIFLSDTERAGVVCAKIAKKKQVAKAELEKQKALVAA